MGRFSESAADDGGETGIDMSPLIDCLFILIIFFVVTTTFVEETGVEVDKPPAAAATQLEKTSIQIAITAEGQVVYDQRDIGVSGVRPLIQRLTRKELVPINIQADKNSPSGTLIKVTGEIKAVNPELLVMCSAKLPGS